MRGYCSTRAHLAPQPAPTAPTLGWQLALATDFQPIEMVVDDAGRTYLTIDTMRGDDAVIPHAVVVVGVNGAQLAQHDFSPAPVGNLFLGRDGALRATVGVFPRTLVRIDASANVTTLSPLPHDAFRFAIASDGSLVSSTVNFHDPDRVVRVAQDGTVMWTSPPIDDGTCGGCLTDVALASDDRIVIATYTLADGTTMYGLDPADGSFSWQLHVDGLVTEGPGIALDGSIRLVTGVTDGAMVPTTIVTAISPDGVQLWQTRLDEDYEQTWDDALPIASDGACFVHTFHSLLAIDASGSQRWRIDTPTNLYYDAAIDASGTLLALYGPLHGLDAQTGLERWHVDGPPPIVGFAYVTNFVLGPHGCVVGASHGGEIFSACDP